jgi:hypothetical protein
MLKLTIFQKNRPSQVNDHNASPINNSALISAENSGNLCSRSFTNNSSNHSQVIQNQAGNKIVVANKKKAEFEKKIRKFI